MKLAERIFDFLASLRLAVLIIVAIGLLSAVGTFYEARYDAEVAQKLVYKSIYMYIVMGALAINLIAVMIDRWPWKQHHTPFVLAHVGILMLLVGSVITQRFGVDGSMSFNIGDSNRHVIVPETEFAVYSSMDGNLMTQLFRRPVDFFLNPPAKKPFKEMIGDQPLEVVDYMHYGLRKAEVVESDKESDGPAIRLQLQNPNVNMTQWILREPGKDQSEVRLGPAKVVIASSGFKYEGGNVLLLKPGKSVWKYEVYTASKGGRTSQGQLTEGDKINTGWMGLQMTALRIFPRARELVTYERRDRPATMARPAVKVRYRGEEHWVGLNSVLKLFKDDGMIWVSFANQRIDVGFPLQLTRFDMGRYQGTMRASSYQSEVKGDQIGTVTISMNEPLHYRDFTFYQASFEQDPETGKPIVSVLSVNRDPGLVLKYLGSFLIVLGAILLFYFKRNFAQRRSGEA
ncbi:MAG: cytochrome c biogenesis protein ResB [Bdellovibrionales bacterium]